MIGLQTRSITVTHNTSDGKLFSDNLDYETVVLKALVQRQDATADTSSDAAAQQINVIKVHVVTPESPVEADTKKVLVAIGDTLTVDEIKYYVTNITSLVDDSNKVQYLPFRWTFTAKTRLGRAN